MPGLNQLKQFSTEIRNLGNEVEIRRAKGEILPVVRIPADVADIDDSNDFIDGIPSADSLADIGAVTDSSDAIDLDLPSVDLGDELNFEDEPFSDETNPNVDLGSAFEGDPDSDAELNSLGIDSIDLDGLDEFSSDLSADNTEMESSSLSEVADSDIENTDADNEGSSTDNIDIDNFDIDSALAVDLSEPTSETNLDEPSLDSFDSDGFNFDELEASSMNSDGIETKDTGEENFSGLEDNVSVPNVDDLSFDAPNEVGDMTDTSESQTGELSDSEDIFNMPDLDNLGMENIPEFNAEDLGNDVSPLLEVPDMEVPDSDSDPVDLSAMDGIDFSDDKGDEFGASDFDLGDSDDDIFNIPGFSDALDLSDGTGTPDVAAPDFSGAQTSRQKPKNSFTDAEYKQFQKNFQEYPLNVRLAIEDLVVNNEFTDEVVFSILEKIFRKVPARQVATELEKLLDITLDVPRDYERRSASEYEAYKKSLEYQIKNKILPAAFFTAAAAVVVFIFFNLINQFIYKPLKANSLYKQGYVLIQEEQYPQSLDKFNEAITYNPVKKWFYIYADGYREHKQYDRARLMYKSILARYKHEKKAGMSWANMEIYETYNYQEAERIIKREILDYYINDADALLLMGDMYLDWAENSDDPTKLALGKEKYDLLSELYGNTSRRDTYLSRQMRYYIRTDDLRQVLQYKAYFYGKKKGLGSDDLTELSGYLLEKRYGTLRPSEQSLRFSIEDVRGLLEEAVKADKTNPVALYNMGRYFEETSNPMAAVAYLTAAQEAFNKQKHRSKGDTYKYINNYRLLGELYASQKEYILAEETYGLGLDLYEKVNKESGFASNSNIGKLYADMADLDYFVSGNLDHALKNYTNSVKCNNDTASVRYKIGFIQYGNKNYAEALSSFIKSYDNNGSDTHLLLALANTLSLRNDNYAAQGYYEQLLKCLETKMNMHEAIFPQVREDQADLVDTYMKATNNLGVTLTRLTEMTGDSQLNAKAIVNFQESLRSWDALTRNQTTMIRLDGSNLAEQNIKYIIKPDSVYKPEIYTQIPRLLDNEDGLGQ